MHYHSAEQVTFLLEIASPFAVMRSAQVLVN